MKKTVLSCLLILAANTYAMVTSCSKEDPVNQETTDNKPLNPGGDNSGGGETPGTPSTPSSLQFTLQGSMQATSDLVGKDYNEIHKYMKTMGWDYSEHPNSAENDHIDGIHCEVVYDDVIKQYVYKFYIHANEKVLDGDRGKKEDRQRNEMKSQTSSSWYKLNGNWDEYQRLDWKMYIPKGYQPSSSFCHLHQLKAQEGNNSSPLITITARSNKDGSNKRIQVIHTGDDSSTSKGTIIDNIPLSDFEDQWVQIESQIHYTHNGSYKIKVTRISDNKVLIDKSFTDLDLWRKGAISIRNKFGIYRSYGSTMADANDRPSNGIKDEFIMLGDFYSYEAKTNPNPQAHD